MAEAIGVVGLACRYPGARNAAEFWENVLSQRAAFRRLPAERLSLADYYSEDRSAPDRTYGKSAAVLEGYEFDRARFRVSGDSFRSGDMAHWLALETAADALADAGFAEAAGLPRETTGVFVGNTLTGEFSRANAMRLRWPYVRRVLQAALADAGGEPDSALLDAIEKRYKAPFPETGDESLAGSLSNTIAGRICNHFDFGGGGYTVDGACSSSLLSIANACAALATGDLDAAVAGGVDLSLDPFELAGFAKAGALAEGPMRVYDARPTGFIPGEGCGMAVLMRLADAEARGLRVYAVVRGWGISSDGRGGLTRPEQAGQLLAIERAWKRAGLTVDAADYFEGHGTGTAAGDATELAALSTARRRANSARPPAAIGSVKALIGHTKAAAGVAGFIKTALALRHRVLPPTAGCRRPHGAFAGEGAALRVAARGEVLAGDARLRAGVSAMGFGGINAHLALESTGESRPTEACGWERLLRSAQDAEAFFFSAGTREQLLADLDAVAAAAPRMAISELTDCAAELARRAAPAPFRAALVAADVEELETGLAGLRQAAECGNARPARGWIGRSARPPRIGFLFPGQGSPRNEDGGCWRRRFDCVEELYGGGASAAAQPAIVRGEAAALRVLRSVAVEADVAVGHSLGELAALHWAGSMSERELLETAEARAATMDSEATPAGAMAALACDCARAAQLLDGAPVWIAGANSPGQTSISGLPDDVRSACERARAAGVAAAPIAVERAFHSPLMAGAAERFAVWLAGRAWRAPQRRVHSTVTGARLAATADLAALLAGQITAPVRFEEAFRSAGAVDLWIECGPGATLSRLATQMGAAAAAVDAGGPSLRGLLEAVAAAWALGAPVLPRALFDDRFTRPFDLHYRPRFLASPCESVATGAPRPDRAPPPSADAPQPRADTTLETLRRLAAERVELPIEHVHSGSRTLSDLHLNSIVVARLVADTCRAVDVAAPAALLEFADSSLEEIAAAIEELRATARPGAEANRPPDGAGPWVRAFRIDWVEQEAGRAPAGPAGEWTVFCDREERRESVARALQSAPGVGVAVSLSGGGDGAVARLLEAAADLRRRRAEKFLLIQQGAGAAAFARSLHCETPGLAVATIGLADWDERAAGWIATEAAAARPGYTEAHYDSGGRRLAPVLRLVTPAATAGAGLTAADVLLVSGGGKGIAAECGLALAKDTGARLAIVGRSRPESDVELARNLARLRAAGVEVEYAAADVTDRAAVARAARRLADRLGPVTAVLHGAGANTPKLIAALDIDSFRRTLAPKTDGLANLLACLDPERLRLVIAFGSIIARIGMAGEADYALANEWMARQVDEWAAARAGRRGLTVEWSVWSGVGMGERLGRMEALLADGVAPISVEEGVRAMVRLARSDANGATVVSGRFGNPATLSMAVETLPFRRYLEQPCVHYPGVELVADSEMNANADPHLADHIYGGQPLLAAVMGLEAMAQVASAAAGWRGAPVFEQVRFDRPLTAPASLRAAALLREDGAVYAVLRSSETGFQAEHFRALCRPPATERPAPAKPPTGPTLAADALYGSVLFQRGRFRRLLGYRKLGARECVAEIACHRERWFHRYAPAELETGDPGARDAVLHAIQACIPHRVLLPTGVERLTIFGPAEGDRIFAHARETARSGDDFVYRVEVIDAAGAAVERWEGLRLRAVESRPPERTWPDWLTAVYLERLVLETAPWSGVEVALGPASPRNRGAHRPDGKPDGNVSFSRCGGRRLSVRAATSCGCDLERVEPRPGGAWNDLLGADRHRLAIEIADAAGVTLDTAGTHVWCALESLRKAGLRTGAPITLRGSASDGAVTLLSGAAVVVSCPALLPGMDAPAVAAIAVEADGEVV
jgi:enediyne polyketide synthase